MTIPWGDVASAYYSTGIQNIEVYTSASPQADRPVASVSILVADAGLETAARAGQVADRPQRERTQRRGARKRLARRCGAA